MGKLNFKILKQKGQARVGEITLNGTTVQTPIFMPVGTKATIKGLVLDMLQDPKILGEDLEPIRLILANTFHLYLRPGDELIKKAGGLHKFENWDKKGLILTDSGGFQVFSLGLGKDSQISKTDLPMKTSSQNRPLSPDKSGQLPSEGSPSTSVPPWRGEGKGGLIGEPALSEDRIHCEARGWGLNTRKLELNQKIIKERGLVRDGKGFPYNPNNIEKARKLRKEMTPAGKKLWFDYLRNTKHKCYRQRPIDHFIADFYISSSDLVIEIDGNIHDSQKEYDSMRTDLLKLYGLQVVRFSNEEVLNNFEKVCETIEQYCKPPLGGEVPAKAGGGVSKTHGGPKPKGHSVNIKLTEEGVKFNSPYDGSKHMFTPENVVDIQCNFGSDIMMVLDVCSPGDADKKTVYAQMQQTHRWAKRAYEHFMKKYDEVRGVLFPIVQGGTDLEMRKESAEYLSQFATDGIAIGGVSVGESKEKVREVVEFTTPLLPEDKPRYLMGVGTPEDLQHAIEHGVDMFDCVLATRLGRHGVAFSDEGNIKLTHAKYKEDFSPLSDVCPFTQQYTKAYIHHLLKEKEILGGTILSLHNIMYLHKMLSEWKKEMLRD